MDSKLEYFHSESIAFLIVEVGIIEQNMIFKGVKSQAFLVYLPVSRASLLKPYDML
jgi:hypothetical protein